MHVLLGADRIKEDFLTFLTCIIKSSKLSWWEFWTLISSDLLVHFPKVRYSIDDHVRLARLLWKFISFNEKSRQLTLVAAVLLPNLELQLKVEKILYIKQKEQTLRKDSELSNSFFVSLISPICVLQIVLRCSISLFAWGLSKDTKHRSFHGIFFASNNFRFPSPIRLWNM